MAYKVGTTIVIDDAGSVPWARISGAPAAGLARKPLTAFPLMVAYVTVSLTTSARGAMRAPADGVGVSFMCSRCIAAA